MDPREWDQIRKKLEAIRSRQERAGTPAEAEAASAAFTRILTRYNLDEAEVLRKLDAPKRRFIMRNFLIGDDSWERILWSGVAKLHFCVGAYATGTKGGWVYGTPENTEQVQKMFVSLHHTIQRLQRYAWQEKGRFQRTTRNLKKKAWMRQYAIGVVHGILFAMHQAREAEVTDPNEKALVVALDTVVEESLKAELQKDIRKAKNPTVDEGVYTAGFYDGVEVGRQRRELPDQTQTKA